MRTLFRRYFLSVALIVLVALSVTNVWIVLQEKRDRPPGVPEDLAKVWEAYETLQSRYVNQGSLDPDKLADGAVRGMIESLDDPFAAYFDESAYQIQVESTLEGKFEGIGATVEMVGGFVTIAGPIPGSPAEEAGLLPGDIILKIAGESVEGLRIYDVVQRIRGPKDTPITITIHSAKTGAISDVTLTRRSLQFPTVASRMLSAEIGYVRILQFAPQTTDELDTQIKDLKDEGAKAILLDLRSNPGGLLTVVIDTTSQFLDGGLVLSEVDADGKRTEWKADDDGRFTEGPLVILVNQFSASGSEVLAGAVQARGRGQLVGTHTYGKGVVNQPVRLADGSGLYVPTANWFTPSGQAIGKGGLTPDVQVERSLEDLYANRDPQLDRGVAILGAALAAR